MLKIFRLSHLLWKHRVPFLPWLLRAVNRIIFSVVLPPSVKMGKNVILSYGGLGTVIHRNTVIGDDVVIASGVTIGGRSGDEAVPVIGTGAFIGSGAKIIGNVKIGKYASIGANAVVLKDIPDYAVAVGVPAKVVRIMEASELVNYHDFKKSKAP
jgi:serine O-acetyltransferase